ncbi:EthD domain-containing protein [Paraphoma chrysanthemicola]|nr:EthD domain-containing protein [Paraphoma chrysanthemicola]
MPNDQLLRVTVCAKRNPNLTEDEFNEHWTKEHSQLIVSWLQRHGCVKYVQYHTTSEHKSRLSQSTLSYDGIADFWYGSFQDYENAYEDPFYLQIVKKDEEYLFDVPSIMVTAGTEVTVIEDGKNVWTASKQRKRAGWEPRENMLGSCIDYKSTQHTLIQFCNRRMVVK